MSVEADNAKLAVLASESQLSTVRRPGGREDGAADDPVKPLSVRPHDVQADLRVVVFGVEIRNPAAVRRPCRSLGISVVTAVFAVARDDAALAVEGQDDDAPAVPAGRFFESL